MRQCIGLYLVLLFLMTSYVPVSAQWKPIGTDGGWPSLIQNGKTFFGLFAEEVYRSSDDGRTWEEVSDGLPQTSFSRIQTLRFDGNDLHVRDDAAAENFPTHYSKGTYVLRENTGQWEFYPDSTHGRLYGYGAKRISSDSVITIIPKPGYMGNVTDTSIIVFTSDAGKSWSTRMPVYPDSVVPRTEYVTVYKGNTFAGMYFRDSSFRTVSDGLFFSTDYGLSWKRSDLPGGYNLYSSSKHALFRRVFATTPDTVDYEGFYRSLDTGKTWEKIAGLPTDDYWNIEFIKDIGDQIFACFQYYSNDSNRTRIFPIFSSLDSGRTWKREFILDSTDWFINLYEFKVFDDGYLMYIRDNYRPFVSLDNQFLEIPLRPTQGIVGTNRILVSAEDGQLVTAWTADSVYRSLDGSTWTAELFHEGHEMARTPWLHSEHFVYTTGRDSIFFTVYRSSDNGKTWEVILREDSIRYVLEFRNDGDTLMLSTQHSYSGYPFYFSTDAGASWQINRLPHYFKAVEYFDGVLYAQEAHPLGRHYAKSSDAGRTWEMVAFPFIGDSLVSRFYIFDSIYYAIGYITTSGKPNITNYWHYIYTSTDRGQTWFRSDAGLPSDAYLYQMYENDGTLFLLSGSGPERSNSIGRTRVFYSYDKGQSWRQVPGAVSEAHAFLVNDQNMYLTSGYGGIWEQSLSSLSVPFTVRPELPMCLSPNPGIGNVLLTYWSSSASQHFIEVVSISGAVMLRYAHIQDPNTEVNLPLDCSGLPTGSYLVRVTNGSESGSALLNVVN